MEETAVMRLSAIEEAELAQCEAVIEKGMQTFVEVGRALLAIRDGRLYRAVHPTFEGYLDERWDMRQSRAYQLMDAARVIENLNGSTTVELPANEAQARPLAGLSPEMQREVWQEVVATSRDHGITAEWVKRAVERKVAVTEGRPEKPIVAPLPAAKYSLILADPPWRYDFSNTSGRAVEQHYPTMDLESICALPVKTLAAENAILFLWATMPKLPEAFQVISAWGFTYKTGAIWKKSGLGMGYYFRIDHELLLVATVGNPGVPIPESRVSSVVEAAKSAHSVKPETFYELIERMYPAAKRIELFSRRARSGWSAWGNEAPV